MKQKQQKFQRINQQFKACLSDLNCLQWRQFNNWSYTFGLGVIVVLFALLAVWFAPMQLQNSVAVELEQSLPDTARKSFGDLVVSQQDAVIPTIRGAESIIDTAELILQSPIERTEKYVNPLSWSEYQAPCNGMLCYSYGMGYDSIYEDYRFHRELCYAAGDGMVYACTSGSVVLVQTDQTWQLEVVSELGTICYGGLSEIVVSVGETVNVGQSIGCTERYVRVQGKE